MGRLSENSGTIFSQTRQSRRGRSFRIFHVPAGLPTGFASQTPLPPPPLHFSLARTDSGGEPAGEHAHDGGKPAAPHLRHGNTHGGSGAFLIPRACHTFTCAIPELSLFDHALLSLREQALGPSIQPGTFRLAGGVGLTHTDLKTEVRSLCFCAQRLLAASSPAA